MQQDASIVTIDGIVPHPNADRLELACVQGYRTAVPKGYVHAGDRVLYVQPDAKLSLDFKAQTWQTNYADYVSKSGRVKTIRLRGQYSNGFIVPLRSLPSVDLSSPSLCSLLGISHYELPVVGGSMGELTVRSKSLPAGIAPSDERNWQNLSDDEVAYGSEVLVTRKLDGTSCTVVCRPDGTYELCSHHMTLKPGHNKYMEAVSPWLPKMLGYAKDAADTVAFRGEVIGGGVQATRCNQDARKPLGFFCYGIERPLAAGPALRYGWYGTLGHFSVVCGSLSVPTVPLLGTAVLTREWCRKMIDAPASDGEGVVVNVPVSALLLEGKIRSSCVDSFKLKSDDYYSKL